MLGAPNATLCVEDLLRGWIPRRIGTRLLVLTECKSTNDAAFDAAAGSSADGLVVLADYQSAGRGRQGRAWVSPRGASVLCSVALEARDGCLAGSTSRAAEFVGGSSSPGQRGASQEQAMGGQLTLAAAVAACEAVREATEVAPSIKWPNDLRVRGRKLAGILTESRQVQQRGTRVWVIGIGINCLQHAAHFPPELRETTTSLEIESRAPVDRLFVAQALVRRLDHWLERSRGAPGELHAAWLHFAEPLGEYVRLRSSGLDHSGRIVSVDPAGGLVVQLDAGGPVWFDPMQTKLL